MTAAAALMLGILLLLISVIGAFMVYERTPAWRYSTVRVRALHVFAALGPMFGGTAKPPEPEIAAIVEPLERTPKSKPGRTRG